MPKFTRDKTQRLDPGGEIRRKRAEERKKINYAIDHVPNAGRPKWLRTMVRDDAGVAARDWRDKNQKRRVLENIKNSRKAQRQQRDVFG